MEDRKKLLNPFYAGSKIHKENTLNSLWRVISELKQCQRGERIKLPLLAYAPFIPDLRAVLASKEPREKITLNPV